MTVAEIARSFVERLERRDWDGFSALLHPDVVYEVPQTRERIRGRDTYVRFNIEYPGDWHLAPEIVLADEGGRDASVLFRWELDGDSMQGIVYLEVDDGVVTKVTDLWPEPYEPPPGREHLVERY
ncbi:MAG TPA: nuclear transport factor 2 family protein [Acidimicrobiales bacterium]|nr:nuclear transport factor 2 family protein [Acidimicrobiales bacterium]